MSNKSKSNESKSNKSKSNWGFLHDCRAVFGVRNAMLKKDTEESWPTKSVPTFCTPEMARNPGFRAHGRLFNDRLRNLCNLSKRNLRVGSLFLPLFEFVFVFMGTWPQNGVKDGNRKHLRRRDLAKR